jgi:UDP-N-acetylglucosamine 2-epimerase (non-hydrolysing)
MWGEGQGRRRVVSIVGTRPEAIKMAPVGAELSRRRRLSHEVLLTNQHACLGEAFSAEAGLVREIDYDPVGRTPADLRRSLRAQLAERLRPHRIDLVLVQGDTASAVAGARAASDCGIPIGHVEAGLRSFDLRQPFPEEGYRMAIDAAADLLFAPTETAADNLRRYARARGRIVVTGNSGIDALLQVRARLEPVEREESGRRLILFTCHRRENQGRLMTAICDSLKRLVADLPVRVVAPLHPNRHVRRSLEQALGGTEHIELVEPLDHEAMVRLMLRSWLILSDSGGLQEEAAALGTPLLVLRHVTERPEALASGNMELVGTNPARIVTTVRRLLAYPQSYFRMARPAFPFGDGRASERIADAIEAWLVSRPPA